MPSLDAHLNIKIKYCRKTLKLIFIFNPRANNKFIKNTIHKFNVNKLFHKIEYFNYIVQLK